MHRVADVLEQHVMDIGRRYFLKHLHTYQVPDLQVRLFVTYNSVIFTLVRFNRGERVSFRPIGEIVARGQLRAQRDVTR